MDCSSDVNHLFMICGIFVWRFRFYYFMYVQLCLCVLHFIVRLIPVQNIILLTLLDAGMFQKDIFLYHFLIIVHTLKSFFYICMQ